MSDAFITWLEEAAASPGVLACAVRRGDRSIEVKSCREEVSETKVTKAMRELAEVNHGLLQNRIRAERILWRFEDGQIRCLSRPGGVFAALVLTNEAANLPETDRLLENFESMFP